jgi:ketosteroid isomerase-like protein
MSEENVELLRRAYERFNTIGRVDPEEVDLQQVVPDLWARLAPDLELQERPETPDRRLYKGREQSKEFWRKTWEIFAEVRWEPQEFIDAGDVVIVVARVIGVGRGSDVPVEMDESDLWWFRDGQIVRIEAFGTKQEALAAAENGPAA